MRIAVALGVVVACALAAAGSGGNATQPNRVLFLAPISSKSHKNLYMGVAEALADRGSQVRNRGRMTDATKCWCWRKGRGRMLEVIGIVIIIHFTLAVNDVPWPGRRWRLLRTPPCALSLVSVGLR